MPAIYGQASLCTRISKDGKTIQCQTWKWTSTFGTLRPANDGTIGNTEKTESHFNDLHQVNHEAKYRYLPKMVVPHAQPMPELTERR